MRIESTVQLQPETEKKLQEALSVTTVTAIILYVFFGIVVGFIAGLLARR